jgi:hypothetical protein
MPRALWIADALRAEGVTVVEEPGWRERGSATFMPKGVICHHTAGPARGDAPSLHTCIHGRSDLPGPLCQIVLNSATRIQEHITLCKKVEISANHVLLCGALNSFLRDGLLAFNGYGLDT